MSYSDFTLRRVKQDFNLTIVEKTTFLTSIESQKPSPFLAAFLEKYLPLAKSVKY
jgi:hypothetical protein